ncbi:hypothetical protein BY996DRAFT_7241479 [Phakopsora pachyrhizi]|nr:hypothetical protein BY996DRAFT_7241479 [Phakopsora pachyrhizi]
MSGRDEWEYAGQEMEEEEEEEKRRRRRGGDDAEEILDQRSPLSAAEAQSSDHNRLTYLTNMTYNTDFESDYGEGSTRYASGHSISSEDPFQYWHYETPRQAREKGTQSHLISQQTLPVLTESLNNQSNQQTEHPRHLSNQPKESLLPGKVPLPQSVLPLQSRSTAQLQLRNFSRPIRSGSAPGDRPLTPPPSREVSPRDLKPQNSNFEIGSASDHRWSNSNLGIDITYQAAESALSDRGIAASRHTSNDDDNQSLGRQSSSSLNSTDSMSLNGTRRSWKKFFQKRKEQDSTAAELSFQPRQPLSSTSPLDLPSITFHSPDISQAVQVEESWTNSQIGKSYEGNWNLMKNEAGMAGKLPHGSDQVQIHFQATNKPISLHGQSADGFEPTRSTYFSHESARESNAVYNKDFNDRRNPKASHRLSIYSLGEGEDLKHSNDNSTQKTRYMSRSPVSVTNFTINSPDSSHQTIDEAESAIQPRAKQVNYSSNLPSAMAKTKATLSSRAQNLNSSSSGMSRSSSKAEEYLQLGIEAHERGDLEKSAGLFERSARENGGCGAGMLMWGLSLRHGWGCQVNEARAFKWLQKAAESVVDNLDVNVAKQSNKKGKEEAVAAKTELVLAIYELGQCFLRGWGCKKDKKLAINYFELAAKLGDPDAQQELGFCYANGQGTKRDLKKAAKYYRMAAEQGVEMMGSQWIWKDKVRLKFVLSRQKKSRVIS